MKHFPEHVKSFEEKREGSVSEQNVVPFFLTSVSEWKARILYSIGQTLESEFHPDVGTIFGSYTEFPRCSSRARFAIKFYKQQMASTRLAIWAWTQVGMSFGVVKDIRIVIGKLIWETKSQALFTH